MAFDLDAVLDEGDERTPFTFTWDGEEYELPPERDIRAVAAIAAGRLYVGLEALLGTEQWGRIQASPKLLTAAKLRSLLDAYAAHIDGLTSGESSASSGSSKSTARPSKRTSKGNTASRSRR